METKPAGRKTAQNFRSLKVGKKTPIIGERAQKNCHQTVYAFNKAFAGRMKLKVVKVDGVAYAERIE
jgi:hypothetical protein